MIKPVRVPSKIDEEFDDISCYTLPADATERLKNVGELLFSRDDIYTTVDPLCRIFRKACVDNNITVAYFNEKYKQYAFDLLGKDAQNASNNRANTLKMLKTQDTLTWRKFQELTKLVLGFSIDNLAVELRNRSDNKVQRFSAREEK